MAVRSLTFLAIGALPLLLLAHAQPAHACGALRQGMEVTPQLLATGLLEVRVYCAGTVGLCTRAQEGLEVRNGNSLLVAGTVVNVEATDSGTALYWKPATPPAVGTSLTISAPSIPELVVESATAQVVEQLPPENLMVTPELSVIDEFRDQGLSCGVLSTDCGDQPVYFHTTATSTAQLALVKSSGWNVHPESRLSVEWYSSADASSLTENAPLRAMKAAGTLATHRFLDQGESYCYRLYREPREGGVRALVSEKCTPHGSLPALEEHAADPAPQLANCSQPPDGYEAEWCSSIQEAHLCDDGLLSTETCRQFDAWCADATPPPSPDDINLPTGTAPANGSASNGDTKGGCQLAAAGRTAPAAPTISLLLIAWGWGALRRRQR